MPTHSTYRYQLGIAIEAIGNNATKTSGYCFLYGSDSPHATSYEYINGALASIPASIETTVNPTTGDLAVSAFTFEFHATDEIAPLLLWQAREDLYRVGDSGGITDTDTTITITDRNGAAVAFGLQNTVIWVGDECIKLGSYTGSGGVYNIQTRAFWNSTAQYHDEGRHIYTENINGVGNPYIRFRAVRLILFDRDAQDERIIWRGYIDEVETSDDGTRISVSCLELFAALKNATVNRESRNLAEEVAGMVFGDPNGRLYVTAQGYTEDEPAGKSATAVTWLQVDDALTLHEYASGLIVPGTYGAPAALGSGTEYEALDLIGVQDAAQKIYQVFVVDSERPSQSSTASLSRPTHPLEIVLALLMSTYGPASVGAQAWDGVSGNWGLGIPSDYIDLDSWQSAIEANPDLSVDRLLLGWDGEPVNVWDTITSKLLTPYGYFLGTSTEGKLNVNRFELFDVQQFANASQITALPNTLKWSSSRASSVQQVVFEVGAFPWRDPDVLKISAKDGSQFDSLRAGIFGEKRAWSYDFSTKTDERTTRALALERINLGFFAMPRLVLKVADFVIDSLDYDMGATVNVSEIDIKDAWFIDVDGNRVAVGDTTQMVGQIIGRRVDLQSMTYTLTMLLTNYGLGGDYVRWIAPAGVVASSTNNTVTLVANELNSVSTDAAFFTDGDEIKLYSADGVNTGETATITRSGNVLTRSSGTWGANPSAGDIVVLDTYNNYSNTGVISGSGIANVYVYQADAQNDLGSSNDDGHRYG